VYEQIDNIIIVMTPSMTHRFIKLSLTSEYSERIMFVKGIIIFLVVRINFW